AATIDPAIPSAIMFRAFIACSFSRVSARFADGHSRRREAVIPSRKLENARRASRRTPRYSPLANFAAASATVTEEPSGDAPREGGCGDEARSKGRAKAERNGENAGGPDERREASSRSKARRSARGDVSRQRSDRGDAAAAPSERSAREGALTGRLACAKS